MAAPTDLRTFLEGYGVLSEVIDELASNRGLSTVTEFVNAIDSKEEAKDAFFEGGPYVKNLGQIGNVKRAWRAAAEKEDKEHEAKAKVTSQKGAYEDLDEPLAQDVQTNLESDFLDAYGWLHLAADKVASDSILGRMRREFLRKQPTILPVSRIRTRADTSYTTATKKKKVSEYACISFNTDDDALEERAPQGLLELFQQFSVLSLSWAIAGIDKVEWDGQQVRYSHWCQTEEYISVLKNRVLDLQPLYTEQ